MSVATVRGGVPHVFRATISAAGREHRLPFTSMFMQATAIGGPGKLYFSLEDYTLDTNFVSIPLFPVRWDGPVEIDQVWMKGDGGDFDIELVAYQRRG